MEYDDPYEQYLLAVFQSCDDYYQGSLSAAGLQQLCEKLQLQDSCGKLTKCLLDDFKSKRVSFEDFKNGLLRILDEMDRAEKSISVNENHSENTIINEKNAIYLKSEDDSDYENENFSNNSFKMQHDLLPVYSSDNSYFEEAVPKKPKKRVLKKNKRKLYTKVSGKSDLIIDLNNTTSVKSTNEVEHLVTAWSNISRGVTDSLNKDDLVKVFQCVGLEKSSEEAAQCVFEKLDVEDNGRITLQELLEFIRSGGSWCKESRSQPMELEPTQKNISMDFIEPSSLGCITGAFLVEQWESAGVPGAPQLLQNLGFSLSQQIDLSSLVSMLSDEIKGLNDEVKSTRRSMDPHLALLWANSVLQIIYIQTLKTMIEHVNAEKEKLRNDVTEANQRALLLAQEVDEHHSKLEHSTQQQVKNLEQKHAEKIRELTNQAKSEQDTLLAQNMVLERKLKQLESDEVKNKNLISQLEMENRMLEQEHRNVIDQLSAVQSSKKKLEKDLENVSVLQQRVSEMESNMSENDVMNLLERIQILEKENTCLRDRNDELSIEVEELSMKLLNASMKKQQNTSNLPSMELSMEEGFVGGGMKRRGDSFVVSDSAEDSGGEEGSPRLGKVRKCSNVKSFADATSSMQELQIQEKKNFKECGQSSPSTAELPFSNIEDVCVEEEKEKIGEENLDAIERIRGIQKKLNEYDKSLGDDLMAAFNELLVKNNKNNEEEDKNLRNRCKELESSLELLRMEYEKTEDYWSEKLEEERIFFEELQKLSDKKYSELLDKILEYEDMLKCEKEQKQRLETIEEKDSFEKQVTEMEEECAELKYKLAETMRMKDLEIEQLKNEIANLKLTRDFTDSGVQVSDGANIDSNESSDVQNSHVKLTTSRKSLNSFQDKNFCKQCNGDLKKSYETKLKYQRELESMREERERLFDEINEKKQIINNYNNSNCGSGGGDNNNKFQNMHLEQRCQTLMTTLRQQQKQTEDILKNTWKQHKAEVNDLKSVLKMTEDKLKCQTKVIQEQLNKLTKTDLLVKDLFVENAYLLSSVQKLEQQCQTTSSTNSKK
ncbi:blastoderm specific protein 25D, putative [Pediculus humanus corporis]|uniref:Blastoderm specific protein 25D, putative n=1 Tax=Pediculus humanus subsp. corporis TaxID=121224 RepID=E0VZG4_PEDHC|nr:blastoderm specific protein 25D, putative [Pediculus humanus corporis]EEB18770.1 blastoderm specific protein 25D, putative [Pediculus humanus corporis]